MRAELKNSPIVLVAVALVCFGADMASKNAIDATIPLFNGQIEVIPGWFRLINVRNEGGMFSFAGSFGPTANSVFAVVGVVFVVLVALWGFAALPQDAPGMSVIFGMILGGAAGNLYDRLIFHGVRDFIEIHYHDTWRYATFNIADSCLVCAVAFLGFAYLFTKPHNVQGETVAGAQYSGKPSTSDS